MSQSIQARLTSSDPQVRRQAIIALGKSGDERALPLLARVYKSDSDPELRQLALKAGQHLKKQLAAADSPPAKPVDQRYAAYMEAGYDDGASNAPSYVMPVYDDEDPEPGYSGYQIMEREEAETPLSDEDRRRAADLARRGLEDFDRGKHEDALNNLIAALDLNPRLKFDSSVQRAAAGLTGQRSDEAAIILADPMRRQMYIGQVQDHKVERAKKTGGVTWGDVTMDLVILVIVVILGTVLLMYGLTTFLGEALQYSDLPPDAIATINSLGMPFILLTGLIGGVGTAVGALIAYGAIHIVSGFFGGNGTLTQTLHALIPVQTVLYVASGVILVIGLLSNSLEIIGLLSFVVSFGGLAWQVSALSKAQDFGWMSGCAALVVAGIVMGLLSWALSFILTAALGGAAALMVPTSGLLLPF